MVWVMNSAPESVASPRFQDIPIPRRDVVEALREDFADDGASSAKLSSLCERLLALYHYELHGELELLKRDYAPFNPDLDHPQAQLGPASKRARAEEFSTHLRSVLERGNYEQLNEEDVHHAFVERSLFPLKVVVDTSVYREAIFYARGETVRTAEVPKWYGLSRDTIDVPTFERVCLFIRFKGEDELGLTRAQLKRIKFEPGTTILKLFRNIPKADLEILFPNCEPRMRASDKLFFGVPALVGGIPVVARLMPAVLAIAILLGLRQGEIDTTSIIAGLSGLVVLGAYLFRQWGKFKHRRMMFNKELSDNLYFRNLDNNEGVLTRLVDEAEEEECKEVLLAYVHLLAAGEAGLAASALDERVERWVRERFEVEVDFEVSDALTKLEDFDLIVRGEGDRFCARPLQAAIARLDARWQSL